MTTTSARKVAVASRDVRPSEARQMSSDFMARRKIYEMDDTQLVYTTVTKISAARSISPQFFNATPKPAPRKPQPISTVFEALPRVKSEESLRVRAPRASLEIRPSVPQRSSSIRSKTNNRSKDLRSTHRQSIQNYSSLDDSAALLSQVDDVAPLRFDSSQLVAPCHPKRISSSDTTELAEDSPLGYTLSRKQCSLPSAEDKPDLKPSLNELRMAGRDSCISHRDRESFLASFPQPPTSSHSRRAYSHRRNSSSQNYSLFPRSPPAGELTFDKDGNRKSPRQSQERQSSDEPCALPEIPDGDTVQTSSPAYAVADPSSSITYAHPIMSFSNPDFSDANLHLNLAPATTGSTCIADKSATQHARLDASQILRKRLAGKVASRWAFGNSRTDRTSCFQQIDEENKTDLTFARDDYRNSLSCMRHSVDLSDQQVDEKVRALRHVGSKGRLIKKASLVFGLKEKASSMSMNHLLNEKPGDQSRWKKSRLRKIICW